MWFLLHNVTVDCLFKKFLTTYKCQFSSLRLKKTGNGLYLSLVNPFYTTNLFFFISLHVFIATTSGSPKYSSYLNFRLIFCAHFYHSYPSLSLFILSRNNTCVLRTFSSFHCLHQRALHAAKTTNSSLDALDGACFHNQFVCHALAGEGRKAIRDVTSVMARVYICGQQMLLRAKYQTSWFMRG
jgi:hypothetical protein